MNLKIGRGRYLVILERVKLLPIPQKVKGDATVLRIIHAPVNNVQEAVHN